jgi:rod shape-determining protein MreC
VKSGLFAANKKIIAIVLSAAILFFIMAGLTARKENGSLGVIGNIVSVPIAPIQTFFSYLEDGLKQRFVYLSDISKLKDENIALQETINQYENMQQENANLKIQNKELSDQLALTDRYATMKMSTANIIAWDAGNWFDLFVIDKGTADGIKVNNSGLFLKYDTVVTSAGLVGRVIQSGLLTSKIQSIIAPDSVVSGMLTKSRQYVEVRGNVYYRDSGLCVIENIESEIDINVGDTIETSGIGGNFVKGVIIGRVKEVITEDLKTTKLAIIEPAVDFKKLEIVTVLVDSND